MCNVHLCESVWAISKSECAHFCGQLMANDNELRQPQYRSLCASAGIGNMQPIRIQSSPIAAIFILCHLRDVHIIFFASSFCIHREHRYSNSLMEHWDHSLCIYAWCSHTFVFKGICCWIISPPLLSFLIFFPTVFLTSVCESVDNDVLNQCSM